MLERTVFARGAWFPVHRASPDCWCRPTLRVEDECALHRRVVLTVDRRERAFVTGPLAAPI